MAFVRTANATVVRPTVGIDYWMDEIRSGPQVKVASRIHTSAITDQYAPDKWLISHVTIVASVDTQNGPEHSKLGKVAFGGVQVNREFPDYYVVPETQALINNNADAFERKLLVAAAPTFLNAHVYLEHVQLPELRKGKVLDVVTRDVGPSVYVDILTATDRKHRKLVADIESGKLVTTSMGAIVQFTICTKCGNVARDESQLCNCVRYAKGTLFVDSDGVQRRVAELCGHVSAQNGEVPCVNFVDASWVRDPAFLGAVLREILKVDPRRDPDLARKVQVAYDLGSRRLSADQLLKTAHVVEGQASFSDEMNELADQEDGSPSSSDGLEAPDTSSTGDPSDEIVNELSRELLDRAKQKARDELFRDDEEDPGSPRGIDLAERENDSLVSSSLKSLSDRSGLSPEKTRDVVRILASLKRTESWSQTASELRLNGHQLVVAGQFIDRFGYGNDPLTVDGYHAVVAVGGTYGFSSVQEFLTACVQQMGRKITQSEARALVRSGQLFSIGRTQEQQS